MLAGVMMLVVPQTRIDNSQAAPGGAVPMSGWVDGAGTGTSANPFQVGTRATLINRLTTAQTVQGTHIMLINNIDLSGANWVPMSNFSANSIFEGNGFTINGLTVNSGTQRAMFINFNGSMRNVTFTNAQISSGAFYTAVVGALPTGTLPAGSSMIMENIHIENSQIGWPTASTGRTGGLFGSFRVNGINNIDRLNLEIRNVSVTDANIRGGNSSGGIIGNTESQNINVLISNAYFSGVQNNTSNIVAGILGATVNAAHRSIIIENSLVRGSLNSAGTHNGGVIGWVAANSAGPNHITIRNTVVIASITGTSTVLSGIVGNVGTGQNTVLIQNTHFSSTLLPGRPTAQGVPAANIVGSGPRTTAEMNSQTFVDLLNGAQLPAPFILGPNGPELVTTGQRQFLNLNANNGSFLSNETIVEHDWAVGEVIDFSTIELPTRWGFILNSWNTMANGEGQVFAYDFADVNLEFLISNRTLYAQWTQQPFIISPLVDSTINQEITFHGPGGLADVITQTQIGQNGFARSSISGVVGYNFVGWMALLASEYNNPGNINNWINIGLGEEVLGEQRLNFYNNGVYLFDETFMNNFGFYDAGVYTIRIRALYENVAPMTFTVDTVTLGQRDFGSVMVDGVNTTFGAQRQFSATHNTPIVLEIFANNFREFDDVTVTMNALPVLVSINFLSISHATVTIPSASIVAGGAMVVGIEFSNEDFFISVEGNFSTVPSAAISDTSVHTIGLGDNVPSITVSSAAGYRLVSNTVLNVRIFNQIAQRYDYFSAPGGNIGAVIAFNNLNETFFERYADINNEITIVAIFVRQHAMNISINDTTMGDVRVTVVTPEGRTLHNQPLMGQFDHGSTIRIALMPNMIYAVDQVFGATVSEINQSQTLITIVLTSSRNIDVIFVLRAFQLEIAAVDMNGNEFDVVQYPDFGFTTSVVADLVEGQTITNINKTYDDEAFEFVGWFADVNGELLPLGRFLDPNTGSLVDIAFNQTFITLYTFNGQLRIVAQFTRIHAVTIDITGNGSFEAFVVTQENGNWVKNGSLTIDEIGTFPFAMGTHIMIEATAENFFRLSGFDGLDQYTDQQTGNSVVILVNGLRFITIVFAEEQLELDITANLSGARGDVEYGTNVRVINDTVVITFNPTSGFELSNWRINERSIAEIYNQFGNIRQEGNTVRLTLTSDWLAVHQLEIRNEITTTMNRAFMFGMLAALIFIPLLVLALTWMMVSNARKKKQYAELETKRQANSVRMGQGDQLKKLREDMDK